MLTFTGVKTGNQYEVGQSYRNGDGTVSVAQADGSFVNQQNGRRTQGSSNPGPDQSVTWNYSGSNYSSGNPFDVATSAYVQQAMSAAGEIAGARYSSGGASPNSAVAQRVSSAVNNAVNNLLMASGRPQSYAGQESARMSFNGVLQSIMQTPVWNAPFNATPKTPISRFQVIDAANGLPKDLDQGVQYYARSFIPGINWFWDMSQAPVDQGWEPFAGEPGEWLGGGNNIVAGAINSVPRNWEFMLNNVYQGIYGTQDEPSFLYVPGFPASTIAMPGDYKERLKSNPLAQSVQSFGAAAQGLLGDLIRGRPAYVGPKWGSVAQEASDVGW